MTGPCPSPDGHPARRAGAARARNARIADAARRHHFGRDANVPFICECEDERCDALIRLTLDEYDAARAAADYLVAPSHQVDHAHIVRVTDGCWLYAGDGDACS